MCVSNVVEPCVEPAGAAEKLEACEMSIAAGGRMGRFGGVAADKKSKDDQQLVKITRDSSKLAVEQVKGMSSQVRPCLPSLRNLGLYDTGFEAPLKPL